MRRIVVAPRARFEQRMIAVRGIEALGVRTARDYDQLILHAFNAIRRVPDRPAASRFDDLEPPLWTYHLRFARRRPPPRNRVGAPRHLILYSFDAETVTILRVLHERMDLPAEIGGLR